MAWTDPRTWVDGELVTASLLNTHLRDNLLSIGEHLTVPKTADESVTSNAVSQNDDELSFAIGANEKWVVYGHIRLSVGAGGFRETWTAPAGATGRWGHIADLNSPTVVFGTDADFGTTVTNHITVVHVVNGATPGTMQYKWAQSSSNAAATSVLQFSFIDCHRYA